MSAAGPDHDPWADDPPQPDFEDDAPPHDDSDAPPLDIEDLAAIVNFDDRRTIDVVDARSLFVDWTGFWDTDHDEAEWLFPTVLARGRSHAIIAKQKAGKSLFALWMASRIATGPDPVAVVYLDYEMTGSDLHERLQDMGYGPDTDFSRLHYALLPTLPPLNTLAGADALGLLLDGVEADHPGHHLLVVIDTTSRAVQGDENSADTIQDYYRYTGIRLKQRGATVVRLDHLGKDTTRGARGSSAKGDDVDIAWELSQADGGIQLQRKLSRVSWVPQKVKFDQIDTPDLNYVVTGDQWPAGTAEVAKLLDEVGIPPGTSGNAAAKMLRDAGCGKARLAVLAAVRFRETGSSG